MKKIIILLSIVFITKLNHCSEFSNNKKLKRFLKFTVGANGKKPLTRAQKQLLFRLRNEFARDPETMQLYLEEIQQDPKGTKRTVVRVLTQNNIE